MSTTCLGQEVRRGHFEFCSPQDSSCGLILLFSADCISTQLWTARDKLLVEEGLQTIRSDLPDSTDSRVRMGSDRQAQQMRTALLTSTALRTTDGKMRLEKKARRGVQPALQPENCDVNRDTFAPPRQHANCTSKRATYSRYFREAFFTNRNCPLTPWLITYFLLWKTMDSSSMRESRESKRCC